MTTMPRIPRDTSRARSRILTICGGVVLGLAGAATALGLGTDARAGRDALTTTAGSTTTTSTQPTTTTLAIPPTTTTATVSGEPSDWSLVPPAQEGQTTPPASAPAVAPAVSATPGATTTVLAPKKRARPKHRKPKFPRLDARGRAERLDPQRIAGAVLAAQSAAAAAPSQPTPAGQLPLLIVAALGFAITCFAVGATPATRWRWRPAAVYVPEHYLTVTLAGVAFLLLAGALLVLDAR